MDKPPLGTKPYFIVLPERIKELAEAIIRNANDTSGVCIQWAEEIIELSAVLENMRKKYDARCRRVDT